MPRHIRICMVLGVFLVPALIQADEGKVEAAKRARCFASDWKDVNKFDAKIERTVDGDTAIIKYQDKAYSVRFLSIDTPETHFMGKSQGYWGEEAADFLKKTLLPGTAVSVELEVDKCDKYGRMLGHIWKGDVNVNALMVQKGYAVLYCIFPNVGHCEGYGQFTQKAINEGLGFFSDSGVDLPYDWRRKQRGGAFDKFVGDIQTKEVYAPDLVERIPVSQRVFFMASGDVRIPYHLSE